MSPNSQEELIAWAREALAYDAKRGSFIWKRRPRHQFVSNNAWAVWNGKHAGQVAGRIAANGYRVIQFAGHLTKASRLAWMIVYAEVPDRIDHQDGDPGNDRIANLRNVSQAENCRNRARAVHNHSGTTGVYQLRNRPEWYAQINFAGHRQFLGSFPTIEGAVAARKSAERSLGFHPNHDRPAVDRARVTRGGGK